MRLDEKTTPPILPQAFPRQKFVPCCANECPMPADIGLGLKTCRFHTGAETKFWPMISERAKVIRDLCKQANYFLHISQVGLLKDGEGMDERNTRLAHIFNDIAISWHLPESLKETSDKPNLYRLGRRLFFFLDREIRDPNSTYEAFSGISIKSNPNTPVYRQVEEEAEYEAPF